MTSEPTAPGPPGRQSAAGTSEVAVVDAPQGSTGPLLAWLIVQLALLLIPAFRVPLAAHYPEPGEQLAAHLMFGGQVVGAGLMFPFLLRDARSTLQVMAAALPFQLAAGYLAGRSPWELIFAFIFVQAWLLVLGLWAACLTDLHSRLVGVAVASCLTVGAGLLRYLRLEFAEPESFPTMVETLPPLPATLAAVEGTPILPGWIALAGLAVAAVLVLLVQRMRRRQDIAPTTPT